MDDLEDESAPPFSDGPVTVSFEGGLGLESSIQSHWPHTFAKVAKV